MRSPRSSVCISLSFESYATSMCTILRVERVGKSFASFLKLSSTVGYTPCKVLAWPAPSCTFAILGTTTGTVLSIGTAVSRNVFTTA